MNVVRPVEAATALFSVPALDCPEELALIGRGLDRLPGVLALHPDYIRRRLRVEFDPQLVDERRIAEYLHELGFPVELAATATIRRKAITWGQLCTLTGLGLLLAAAAAWFGSAAAPLAELLAAAATLVALAPVARAGWRAARLRALDMNVLMTIAAVGGLATGNVFETATALVLFGIALWLESLSMERARRAVQSLVELSPKIARRVADGTTDEVDCGTLRPGDRVQVLPGERIPADGQIEQGTSDINQAPITGESMPVTKGPGDNVFAGTLNGHAALRVLVQRSAEESTLAHIARLVETAQAGRSRTERFVDRFARRYTPLVTMLAVLVAVLPPLLLGGVWSIWVYRGLVLLVIACPCALVISTPLTIVCGLTRGTRAGLLIKGGEHLESAGRIEAVAFDKTGTLTLGQPSVVHVETLGRHSADDVLRLAAALEQQSQHPLAQAVVEAARQRGLTIPEARDVAALHGRGVQGVADGEFYRVGSLRLIDDLLGEQREQWLPDDGSEAAIVTSVYLATRHRVLGRIDLGDAPRPDAHSAIGRLRRLGIRPIALLTGDQRRVADHLAAALEIDESYAELLPRDKVDLVCRLMHRHPRLAMVGDGVNDAPALASSRLGIALGQQASDTALETADVVVMSPHVERIADLIVLGRKTRRVLVQNIVLALAIKLIVLLAAAGGWATMWMAVAADVGASLLVIGNGMRLLNTSLASPGSRSPP